MPSLNKAIIIGHLGKDPECRFLADQTAVANFSVATSEKWKDKQTGEAKESTEWHRISCFGKLAEIVQAYYHKGDAVYVEGKIKTRKWTDKDGNDRYVTEIIADTCKNFAKRDSSGTPVQNVGNSGSFADFESDIPF